MFANIDFSIITIYHILDFLPNPKWHKDKTITDNFYILGMSMDGQADYIVNNNHYTLNTGDIILLPPCVTREAYTDPKHPWYHISIAFSIQFANEESRQAFDNLPTAFTNLPESFLHRYRELSHVWTGKRNGYLLKSKILLSEFIYDLLMYQDRQRFLCSHYSQIINIQEYIQLHFAEDLHTEDLASLCGISVSHFRKIFHAITGMNCTQYINLVKIEIAKNLLLSGSANVSEAASITGFSDIYYFSKVFKKVTGFPPSKFKA